MLTPPAALSDWIRELLGADVDEVREPLAGASTATIWPLVAGGRSLIAKVYDLGIDGVGADDVRRDAAAMRTASEVGLVAPRLVAADEAGARLGVPAIVMSRLDGAPRPNGGADPERWVDGLADVLIAVARAPRPTEPLSIRAPWFALPVEAPSWTSDPSLWPAISEVLAASIPAGPDGFIHRDFHQLNVVWNGDEAVGLVDWVNGCLGPVESDIACCRFNIACAEDARDGIALADRFLERCRDAGLAWHPLWDLEWLAGAADIERMVEANVSLGATSTVQRTAAVFDELAQRALTAAAEWSP